MKETLSEKERALLDLRRRLEERYVSELPFHSEMLSPVLTLEEEICRRTDSESSGAVLLHFAEEATVRLQQQMCVLEASLSERTKHLHSEAQALLSAVGGFLSHKLFSDLEHTWFSAKDTGMCAELSIEALRLSDSCDAFCRSLELCLSEETLYANESLPSEWTLRIASVLYPASDSERFEEYLKQIALLCDNLDRIRDRLRERYSQECELFTLTECFQGELLSQFSLSDASEELYIRDVKHLNVIRNLVLAFRVKFLHRIEADPLTQGGIV